MADSSDEYDWIIYLAVAFFMFVLPLLKKVADAVAGRKKTERKSGRPAGGEDKRGVFGEMLDEVEDYVRKAREEPPPGPAPKKQKEIAPFDIWYQERKQEIENKRQRREERRRRRLEALTEAEQAVVKEPEPEPEPVAIVAQQPALEPSIRTETPEIPVMGELKQENITSLGVREPDGWRPVEKEEGIFKEILGDIPEIAQAVVLAEILSAPKYAEGMS